jgi:hypothetical protein
MAFCFDSYGGIKKILISWGARITWTVQREHVGKILRGLHAFHDGVAFSRQWGGLRGGGDGG